MIIKPLRKKNVLIFQNIVTCYDQVFNLKQNEALRKINICFNFLFNHRYENCKSEPFDSTTNFKQTQVLK